MLDDPVLYLNSKLTCAVSDHHPVAVSSSLTSHFSDAECLITTSCCQLLSTKRGIQS